MSSGCHGNYAALTRNLRYSMFISKDFAYFKLTPEVNFTQRLLVRLPVSYFE